MKPKLTRAAFRAWLESKRPIQIVGKVCKTDSCPIASYLHEQGFPNAIVYPSTFAEEEISGRYFLPDWAKAFVHKADGKGTIRNISAARALKILDSIK